MFIHDQSRKLNKPVPSKQASSHAHAVTGKVVEGLGKSTVPALIADCSTMRIATNSNHCFCNSSEFQAAVFRDQCYEIKICVVLKKMGVEDVAWWEKLVTIIPCPKIGFTGNTRCSKTAEKMPRTTIWTLINVTLRPKCEEIEGHVQFWSTLQC